MSERQHRHLLNLTPSPIEGEGGEGGESPASSAALAIKDRSAQILSWLGVLARRAG